MQDHKVADQVAQGDLLVHRAIQFATAAHVGQTRKITGEPYIWHPLAVGRRLTDLGCSVEVISAGILHDVVEDTPTTLLDVERNFGPVVSQLVDYCSEPSVGRPWEERKNYLIQRIRRSPLGSRLIVAVDKLDNLQSVSDGLDRFGTELWDRFSRGSEEQEWYYRSIAASVRGESLEHPPRDSNSPRCAEFLHPIFDELDERIFRLFGARH